MKTINSLIFVMLFAASVIVISVADSDDYTPIVVETEPLEDTVIEEKVVYPVSIYQCEVAGEFDIFPQVVSEEPEKPDTSDAEIIAKVVRAEAGNQDEFGKRLVVDVILNRVDSDEFPNTVADVVHQKNQFAKGYYYTDDDLKIVTEEMEYRMDYEIIYFRTGKYHTFGTPAYQHGAHFFSKGKEIDHE